MHEEERGHGDDRDRVPLQRAPVKNPPSVRAQKNWRVIVAVRVR